MNTHLLLSVLMGALVSAPASFAADTGLYLGASTGWTKAKDIDTAAELDAQNALDGFTTASTVDNSDYGWKLHAGYRFSQHYAIEGSYVDLGEAQANSIVIASPFGTGSVHQRIEVKTWAAALVGIVPLGRKVELFAAGGFHYWDAEWNARFDVTGLTGGATESGKSADLMYGIGADYRFTRDLALRAEWDIYKGIGKRSTTGKSDVAMGAAGLQYNF